MSRYAVPVTIDSKSYEFAYGYDRPMQTYFWQLFDEAGELLVDEGGLVSKTGVQLCEAIDKYKASGCVPEGHRDAALMDMPIE